MIVKYISCDDTVVTIIDSCVYEKFEGTNANMYKV